jgi:hypothetical protein
MRKKQIKITIENIYCDDQKDLQRLRKFSDLLNRITKKYLVKMATKHYKKDISIIWDNGTYKDLKFSDKYEFDCIVTNHKFNK